MIGNLTAIQTLDLSYNEINDLSEPDIFEPPTNLTNLYLSHNRLTHLPFNKILPLPNLKILDLESNSIGVFDETFMKIINNGTKVRYHGKTSYFCSKEKYIFPKKKKKRNESSSCEYRSGNSLHCDCHVRPLKRWLATKTEIPEEWSNVSCESPHFLAGKPLSGITEDLMGCGERDVKEYPEFDITPDVKYRNIE